MSDSKYVPGPDPLQAVAGPHTTLDKENPDKGMPSVGSTLLYQLPPDANGLAFSRPFVVTSVHSQDQHVNGWLMPDFQLDHSGQRWCQDIPFGTPGQADTWHWPVKGYTGRSDAPQPVPIDEVEHVTEVPPDATQSNVTAPLTDKQQRKLDKRSK